MILKNKRNLAIASAIIIIVSSGFFLYNKTSQSDKDNLATNTIIENVENVDNLDNVDNNETLNELKFIESLAGVKANNLEIINNPVGIKGSFIAPEESILNGINYFLRSTNNDKMNDINIKMEEGYLTLKLSYKVSDKISTPIEVKVIPKLNENNDLEIKFDKVKFLDLKISNWVVNTVLKSFIKDWFPEDQGLNIDFKKGSVIIYKDNFEGISIDKINIDNKQLNIDLKVDFNSISKLKNK